MVKLANASYEAEYPIYGAKFLNDTTLLVTGGGGQANREFPNKLTAFTINLDKKKKPIKKFRELKLNENNDAPTTLDANNNVILLGCNEGKESVLQGHNHNFQKFLYHNEHLKYITSTSLEDPILPTTQYQKVVKLSYDASIAAIASSKTPTIIRILDPINLIVKYEIETNNEVKDLDISRDGKSLAYITNHTLEIISIVTGRSLDRRSDFKDQTLSRVRFFDNNSVLIGSALKTGGIQLSNLSLNNSLKATKEKVISTKVNAITSIDVNQKNGVVAISGSENSVILLKGKSFKQIQKFDKLHNLAITQVTFSPDGKFLASVSAARTIHIIEIPDKLGIETHKIYYFFLRSFQLLILAIVVQLGWLYYSTRDSQKVDISEYFTLKQRDSTPVVDASYSTATTTSMYPPISEPTGSTGFSGKPKSTKVSKSTTTASKPQRKRATISNKDTSYFSATAPSLTTPLQSDTDFALEPSLTTTSISTFSESDEVKPTTKSKKKKTKKRKSKKTVIAKSVKQNKTVSATSTVKSSPQTSEVSSKSTSSTSSNKTKSSTKLSYDDLVKEAKREVELEEENLNLTEDQITYTTSIQTRSKSESSPSATTEITKTSNLITGATTIAKTSEISTTSASKSADVSSKVKSSKSSRSLRKLKTLKTSAEISTTESLPSLDSSVDTTEIIRPSSIISTALTPVSSVISETGASEGASEEEVNEVEEDEEASSSETDNSSVAEDDSSSDVDTDDYTTSITNIISTTTETGKSTKITSYIEEETEEPEFVYEDDLLDNEDDTIENEERNPEGDLDSEAEFETAPGSDIESNSEHNGTLSEREDLDDLTETSTQLVAGSEAGDTVTASIITDSFATNANEEDTDEDEDGSDEDEDADDEASDDEFERSVTSTGILSIVTASKPFSDKTESFTKSNTIILANSPSRSATPLTLSPLNSTISSETTTISTEASLQTATGETSEESSTEEAGSEDSQTESFEPIDEDDLLEELGFSTLEYQNATSIVDSISANDSIAATPTGEVTSTSIDDVSITTIITLQKTLGAEVSESDDDAISEDAEEDEVFDDEASDDSLDDSSNEVEEGAEVDEEVVEASNDSVSEDDAEVSYESDESNILNETHPTKPVGLKNLTNNTEVPSFEIELETNNKTNTTYVNTPVKNSTETDSTENEDTEEDLQEEDNEEEDNEDDLEAEDYESTDGADTDSEVDTDTHVGVDDDQTDEDLATGLDLEEVLKTKVQEDDEDSEDYSETEDVESDFSVTSTEYITTTQLHDEL